MMSSPGQSRDLGTLFGELRKAGVRIMRLLFTDLHGVARGKDIQLAHFESLCEEGVAFAAAVMATDLRARVPVTGSSDGYIDMLIRPDLDTIRVAPTWREGDPTEVKVAWCVGDAWTLDGRAYWPVCPRTLLQRVADRYADRDLRPVVAPELEFVLCERDASAHGGLRRYVDEPSRIYTVGPASDPRELSARMLLWCDDLGLQAFAANHEWMKSQYEINLKHSGALDAADRAFMLKHAVQELAVREGLLATFMGRPFADQGGSGFHLHASIAAEGRNVFGDPPGPNGISPVASRFIAGVLEHANGLQALLAPTVNAYKRILPDSLAPTHANWAIDNRTAFVRVPLEGGASRSRIEVRGGDGAACPHLITAAILSAGLDGIERELDPPPPVAGNAYRLDDAHAGPKLPVTLGDALDALEADSFLVEALGPALVSTFVAMKRGEVARFVQEVGELDVNTISAWELEEYAAYL
jgi:glutamine synthetase